MGDASKIIHREKQHLIPVQKVPHNELLLEAWYHIFSIIPRSGLEEARTLLFVCG
jgi:hypothetical protein